MAIAIADALQRLQGVKKTGSGYMAKCPAHDDKNASLSVTEGEAGRVLFHCHAGCSSESVAGALGLSMADLMGEDKRKANTQKTIVATYDYMDENGKLLFQKVRYEPKKFTIRRPDGRGGWEYNRKGVRLIPYNLQALLSSDYVFLVEGEKDVDTLRKMELAATCSPDGAGPGKFKVELVSHFKDKSVYIVPDNDAAGKDFAIEEARLLAPAAKSVKVLNPLLLCPNLPAQGDITDVVRMLGAQVTKQALKELIKSTPEYKPVREQDGRDWVDNPPRSVAPPSLETMSARELFRQDLPPLREIVKGLLPQGLGILCAPSKYGKSWLGLDLCLSVAAGEPFLGFQTEKAGVLYLALEDGYRRLKKRISLILKDKLPPDCFDMAIKAGTVDNGLTEQINAYLRGKTGTGLIVIDVLQRVRSSGSRGNSNAYALDYSDMGALKAIADAHEISVLVIHHLRKMQDKDDPFAMISGTTGIMGCADTIFLINKKNREAKEATLHIVARDIEASDLVIEFDGTFLYKWRLVGTAEEQKSRNERREYEADPVVKTIKGLLDEYPSGFQMTAGGFVAEMPNYSGDMVSATSAGMAFKKLSPQLFRYDNIIYSPGDTKTRRHSFKKQAAPAGGVGDCPFENPPSSNMKQDTLFLDGDF